MKTIYKMILTVLMFYSDYNDNNALPKGETVETYWNKRATFYKEMCDRMLKVITK